MGERQFFIHGRINVFLVFGKDFWETTIIPNTMYYYDIDNHRYILKCFYNPGSEWMYFMGCFEMVENVYIYFSNSRRSQRDVVWILSFYVSRNNNDICDHPIFEYHENMFTFIQDREIGGGV